MTRSTTPLMPDEIVDCMANGRTPTAQELHDVAERIWTDGAANRSAFGWARLDANSIERVSAFRNALTALVGSGAAIWAAAAAARSFPQPWKKEKMRCVGNI